MPRGSWLGFQWAAAAAAIPAAVESECCSAPSLICTAGLGVTAPCTETNLATFSGVLKNESELQGKLCNWPNERSFIWITCRCSLDKKKVCFYESLFEEFSIAMMAFLSKSPGHINEAQNSWSLQAEFFKDWIRDAYMFTYLIFTLLLCPSGSTS